jgi:hypothetical protein
VLFFKDRESACTSVGRSAVSCISISATPSRFDLFGTTTKIIFVPFQTKTAGKLKKPPLPPGSLIKSVSVLDKTYFLKTKTCPAIIAEQQQAQAFDFVREIFFILIFYIIHEAEILSSPPNFCLPIILLIVFYSNTLFYTLTLQSI